MLGYDLTDPRECVPEYRADFGKDRSAKPIDWGFRTNGSFAFFVEAKEVGEKGAEHASDVQRWVLFALMPVRGRPAGVLLSSRRSGGVWG